MSQENLEKAAERERLEKERIQKDQDERDKRERERAERDAQECERLRLHQELDERRASQEREAKQREAQWGWYGLEENQSSDSSNDDLCSSPFPMNPFASENLDTTSIGGKTSVSSGSITNFNSGNTTTTVVTNSNNDSSVRIRGRGAPHPLYVAHKPS